MHLAALQDSDPQWALPLSLTLLAYFTGGVTGGLAAQRRGYDVIGILFLALISAAGGGLIRDGLLLSKGPATVLTDGRYLLAVFAGGALTLFFQRQAIRFQRALAIIDSLGLGAFAVIGVQVTLNAGLGYTAAILGGTLTSVGGGLMRDVLVREEPLLFKPGQFYAMVAVGGCVLFVALLHWHIASHKHAALATILAVFLVRILAIRFNWRTSAPQL